MGKEREKMTRKATSSIKKRENSIKEYDY